MKLFWEGFEKRAAEGDKYIVDNDYAQVKARPQTQETMRSAGKGGVIGAGVGGLSTALSAYFRAKGGKKDRLLSSLRAGLKGGAIGGGIGGSFGAGHAIGKNQGRKEVLNSGV